MGHIGIPMGFSWHGVKDRCQKASRIRSLLEFKILNWKRQRDWVTPARIVMHKTGCGSKMQVSKGVVKDLERNSRMETNYYSRTVV